jgi:hypothetical protein
MLAALAIPAFAALFGPKGDDLEKKRAEVRKQREEILGKLYAQKPEAKAKIQNAAGYGTFNNRNLNLSSAPVQAMRRGQRLERRLLGEIICARCPSLHLSLAFQPVLYPGRRKSLLFNCILYGERVVRPPEQVRCLRSDPTALPPRSTRPPFRSLAMIIQLQLLPFPGDVGFLAIHSCIPAPSLTFVRRTRLRESAVVRQLTPILQISILSIGGARVLIHPTTGIR